jgi:hypothetical protein
MTVKELLNASCIQYDRKDASKLGERIKKLSIQKKVGFVKVEETIFVNDYPESFIAEMEDICLEYFRERVGKNE